MKDNIPHRSVEDAVTELRQLLSQVFHALKERATSMEGAHEIEPVRAAFAEAGIAGRHKRLLITLGSTGPLSVGELAKRMNLTSATTSLIAGELERAGFLERHEDPNDRRRTIVSLPEHLRAPFAVLASASAEPFRRTLEQLDQPAREHFLAGLRLLAAETSQSEAE